MEKYAVEVSKETEQEKKASNNSCIDCGAELNNKTNIKHCKNCGTKPFETKK